MKRIIILILALAPLSVLAQTGHAGIVARLAQTNLMGASVNVTADCNVNMSEGSLEEKVKGYRVRIYFGNSQTSRSEAYAAQSRFKSMFPDISSQVNYTAPYFKVTVGNFLTREEAVMLWGKVLETFPTAFVVSYKMPIGAFTSSGNNIEIASDEVEEE